MIPKQIDWLYRFKPAPGSGKTVWLWRPPASIMPRRMNARHETIDCQRLLCPMPVIRVQDRVATLVTGDTLTAVCTDPGVLLDIPAWCRINGHELISTESADGEYLVTLRVGKDTD